MPQTRKRAAGALLTTALLCGAVPAAASAADDGSAAQTPWSRTIQLDAGARELGLRAGAPDRALARAAIARSAERLGLTRRGGVRLASSIGPGAGSMLRFEQTLGGLRVAWSDLTVTVRSGRVSSISGTTMRLRGTLAGEHRIGPARAVAVARRAVAGAEIVRPAEFVVYAGSPAEPRRPRRAYVVEVTPAGQQGHSENSLCVVVDAQSGRVLARWKGKAADRAVKRGRPRAAAAQTPGTVLYQLTNFARQPAVNNYPYGKTRLVVFTTGNPYLFGSDVGLGAQFSDVFDQNLSWLSPWITDVTRFFCKVRDYCGRDSGSAGVGSGDYNRWFMVGNHFSEETLYRPSDKHILMGRDDSDDPDVLAHEVGHAIDDHFEGSDYLDTFEGDEVREALADMFSYDWDRDGRIQDGANPSTPGGTNANNGSTVTHFADPASIGEAAFYSGYDCTTTDEHDNGSILDHAYHRLVTKVGHPIAGDLLQYIPMALPARREFGDVREAFERTAEGLYPNGGQYAGSVEEDVDDAFNEVGVKDASRRVDRCPGAKP